MMLPALVVCEDGDEYTQRFRRFFGASFTFVRATDAGEARAAVAAGARGLLLDLDFRRTPPERLVDETGRTSATRALPESRRLSSVQGILVLRALRADGIELPALLFADLDDAGQVAHLERTLAPLTVVPSSVALPTIGDRLRQIVAVGDPAGPR